MMFENNPFVDNYELEHDIYMRRRHDVAMEGHEQEVNFEENGGQGNEVMFEEMIQNERVFPELNGMDDNGMNQDYIPLERPNPIDIDQEEYEFEEYERARQNDCAWEDIRSNLRWTDGQLGLVQWRFPSNMMKEAEIKFVEVDYELKESIKNEGEPSIGLMNKVGALFNVCNSCKCCERHNKNFPEQGEIQEDGEHANVVELEDAAFGEGGKENNCICACRHIARRIADVL